MLMKMLHVVVFKCSFCVFSEFGNAWANENIFSVTEGIIWFRYHNYLASKLYEENPSWSDEELFQNARKRVIATFQVKQIVLNYWLTSYKSTGANLEGCTAISFTPHFLWTLAYECSDSSLDFWMCMCFVIFFFFFFQKIAFYEWLPAYLGTKVTSYPGESMCVFECAHAQVICGLSQSQTTHLRKFEFTHVSH